MNSTSTSGNPLPADGVVGRLTPSQYSSLKAFWKEFFRLIDQAPEIGTWKGEHEVGRPETDSKADNAPSKNDVKDEHLKEKLRSEQELKDAKAALEKYGRVKFLESFWGMIMMDDPDVIVLKFLRARKWNVSAGVAMMAACMKWRIEFGVEEIIRKGEEGLVDCSGFIHQMTIGKSFVQGTDKLGRPVVYINVKLHKMSDQTAKGLEDYIISIMESVRLMLTPPLVEKTTIVIDMTGFGLANMDWRSLSFIVKCLEAYYPESLNVLIVHNPPWVFQGLWKIIQPMLDPVVRAKILMTKTSDELKVHIDERHLLKSLGGTGDWSWSYEPVRPSENEKMEDLVGKNRELRHRQTLVQAHMDITRQWCDEPAPGQETGNDHDVKKLNMSQETNGTALLRCYVMYHMRVHYFVLDPYVRGRSVYHRKGNVVGNGLVTFEYPRVLDKDGSGQEIDEWEVLGYPMSRENLLLSIQSLKATLKKHKMAYPDF